MKLSPAQIKLLEILDEGNPVGLLGIAAILPMQSLLDKGYAEPWMMNTFVITPAGKAVLIDSHQPETERTDT